MADFTTYLTKEGDTWTGIAFKAYGDITKFGEIMAANPYAPGGETLPGNVVLFIPIQIVTTKNASLDQLPIWKRNK